MTAVAATATRVSIHWTASTDNVGVASYIVNRNGQPIVTTTTPTTFYSDTNGTAASTTYAYTVAALDASGNTSALSSAATTTTFASGSGDIEPPSAPGTLTASALSSTQISLSWNAASDNKGVSGYNIYRAASSLGAYSKVGTSTTTSYINTGLTTATNYFYVVKAFDGYPYESTSASNEATAKTQ